VITMRWQIPFFLFLLTSCTAHREIVRHDIQEGAAGRLYWHDRFMPPGSPVSSYTTVDGRKTPVDAQAWIQGDSMVFEITATGDAPHGRTVVPLNQLQSVGTGEVDVTRKQLMTRAERYTYEALAKQPGSQYSQGFARSPGKKVSAYRTVDGVRHELSGRAWIDGGNMVFDAGDKSTKVPLSQLESVTTSEFDEGGTGMLLVAGLVAALGVAVAIALSNMVLL